MHVHEKINYLEYPSQHIEATKVFFSTVFQWQFEDFGPDYCAFYNAGLDGGFYRANLCSRAEEGAALVVLFSENLEDTQEKIMAAGGRIVKPIFDFPGGRRFHFREPGGNELAVWSKP